MTLSLSLAGSFGRRASDGGANLHIYYPANGSGSTGGGQPIEGMYNQSPAVVRGAEGLRITGEMSGDVNTMTMEGNDESNDEIKRCELWSPCLFVAYSDWDLT